MAGPTVEEPEQKTIGTDAAIGRCVTGAGRLRADNVTRERTVVSEDSRTGLRSVSIQVDLTALRQNLQVARRLSGNSRLFATIKADAYGHGAVVVARALSDPLSGEEQGRQNTTSEQGADGFAVVTLGEAMELRDAGIEQPILVLQGPQTADAAASMAGHRLWPVIHDQAQYAWYREHVDRSRLCAWLKVDSGMGRLGFRPHEARAILDRADDVQWMGLMTHFACADETGNDFTLEQTRRFERVRSRRPLQRSLANSAAILAWPQTRADWARPGIMLYGCNPLDRGLETGARLTPVMTAEAPLIAVKHMPCGAGIGYAQAWTCPEDMPVGYVAAGYRDGVPRALDDSATVAIDGKRCPIIGRVSMDSMAVDLRTCPTIQVGQSVELWGRHNPVEELAQSAGTISYELLTGIRGPRHYVCG